MLPRIGGTRVPWFFVKPLSHGGDQLNVARLFQILLLSLVLLSPRTVLADWGDDQYTLAADHYRNGRWDQAITEFTALTEKEPSHPRSPLAHFFLGESYIQLQKYPDCIGHFDQFIQQVAKHPLRTRGIFRRAEAHYLIGNDNQAIQEFELLVKTPEAEIYSEFVLAYLGEMYQRRGSSKDLKRAQECFEQALAKHPNSSLSNRCRLGLAQLFQSNGEYREADRFLAFLIESGDEAIVPDAKLSRASILVELQDWSTALELLNDDAIEQLGPGLRAKARYWRGRAELGVEDWEAAVEHLRAAIGGLKDQQLAEAAVYDCAIALWRLGDMDGAESMLQRYVDTWSEGRWSAEARFLRIQAALETGDSTIVQPLVNEFANHHPGHPLWVRVLEAEARAAFTRGDYRQAIESFERLIAKPSEPNKQLSSWYYMLAVSQMAIGNYVVSLENLDSCMKRLMEDRDDPVRQVLQENAHFAKCTALMKLEKYTQARSEQLNWLAKYPQSAFRPEIVADHLACLIELEDWEGCETFQSQLHPLLGASGERLSLGSDSIRVARHYFDGADYKRSESWFQLAAKSIHQKVREQATSGLAWADFSTSDGERRDQAFDLLMTRFADNDMTANAALRQAESLAKEGRLDEARKVLRKALEQVKDWPNRHYALALLARLTVKAGSRASQKTAARLLEEAIETAESHETEAPLDAYLYDLAWLHMDLGEPAKGQSAFRRIHLNYPNSRYWADATFRVAQSYFDQGKYDLASELLQELETSRQRKGIDGQILVTDGLIVHVHYLQAMVAVKQTNWEQVEEHCNDVCREDPDHALRWNAEYWKAEALYRRGNYVSASTAFRAVVERTEGRLEPWVAMAHLRLAQSVAQRQQWEEALTIAQRAQKLFKDFHQDYELDYLMGRALAQDARFEEARASYQRVIDSPTGRQTETAAMAQWMIGETYFHQEKYALAANAYHRTETLFAFPQWQAAALLQAGKCHEHLRQESDAISVYRQLIREYAGHSLAEQAEKRLDRLVQKQNLTATRPENPIR